MAKKHLIDTGRWTYPPFYKLSADEKVVMTYLISNPLASKSGIYRILSGAIIDGVGEHILPDTAKVRLILDNLEKKNLIKYDRENHILYILKFHERYVPFGSLASDLLAAEILKEMTEFEQPEFWALYVEENFERANEFFDEAIKNSKNPDKLQANISIFKVRKIFTKEKP